MTRPDRRCFLLFGDCRPDAYGPLVAAASTELHRDLYTTIDDDDEPVLHHLTELGFTIQRHEHHFRIPVDTRSTGVPAPTEVDLISAADADLDALRLLDNALRQDIPGSDGWQWDADGFRDQTFGPDFDPALYLVAVDRRTGAYIGLIRIWMNPAGPRLGCLAVLPPYRRTRVTAALVTAAASALHERGHREVVTEISADNHAANALLARRGAVRIGGAYELLRPGG